MVCFNPRARGGRDSDEAIDIDPEVVSIHAPAGGATFDGKNAQMEFSVSIHAPAGGATRFRRTKATANKEFQSTRPRGARHAFKLCLRVLLGFNPRARGGRDIRIP